MTAGTLFVGRGVTVGRLAIIFLLLVAIFLSHDLWLPRAQDVYHKASGAAFMGQGHSEAQHQPDSNSQDVEATPNPPPGTTFDSHESSSFNDTLAEDEECLHLPGADKVMVMLKTGATELYQKLPTHFVTTFKCIPNFMVFSDLEQTYGDITIYDAIKPVSKKMRDEHEDFKLYREIQKWEREGQDLSKLKGDEGWNLDRWKFLPMFHQVFEAASDDIEWFVMIEADTSLSWLNLLLWLKTMDPNKPYYLGAQNQLGATTFAHGGSGIVISRKAADILEAARDNAGHELYDEKWEEETAKTCCGDGIIAMAFLAVDIPLTAAWPLIQGEKLSTVDFTEHNWCAPPITWHHVSPIEVDSHFQFEKRWTDTHGWETPFLYRDVFDAFLQQHISVNRSSWNNLSRDYKYIHPSVADEDDPDLHGQESYEQESVESADACAAACLAKSADDCVQWMWMPGRCYLGRAIRFGASDEREEEHWHCGWVQERLERFRKDLEGCKVRWAG